MACEVDLSYLYKRLRPFEEPLAKMESRAAALPLEYRVYVLNQVSRPFSPAEFVTADNDEAAREMAKRLLAGQIIVRIPIQSGHRFRFEAGRRSEMKPAT